MDIEQMKKDLGGGNVFPIGEENVVFAKYFTGECYLNTTNGEKNPLQFFSRMDITNFVSFFRCNSTTSFAVLFCPLFNKHLSKKKLSPFYNLFIFFMFYLYFIQILQR